MGSSEFVLRSGLKRELAFAIASQAALAPSRGRTRSSTAAALSPTTTSALLSPSTAKHERSGSGPRDPGPCHGATPPDPPAALPLPPAQGVSAPPETLTRRVTRSMLAKREPAVENHEPQPRRFTRSLLIKDPDESGSGTTTVSGQPKEVPENLKEVLATGLLDVTKKKGKEMLKPPPTLPDELLEEIFLRLPQDEPAWLVRACLTSKLWFSLLSGLSFRGRYLELHGAPAMLGFLYIVNRPYPGRLNFVPTTKFRPRLPDGGWRRDWYYEAQHCRHGRVLLATDDEVVPVASHRARILHGTAEEFAPEAFIVWNPMTGYQREFDKPDYRSYMMHQAAVLCAVSGCDHRTCHEGPFRVVFFGADGDIETENYNACVKVFSSETGQWSEPCPSLPLEDEPWFASGPRQVLIEDAVYFKFAIGEDLAILKYDMRSECLTLIDVPVAGLGCDSEAILMAMEDGSLGFALMDELSLYVWSREMGSWTKRRTIDLDNLPPMKDFRLKGHVEGSDIVVMTTNLGIYEFDVKSLRLKKLYKKQKDLAYLIPYTSFYYPQGNLKKEDAT